MGGVLKNKDNCVAAASPVSILWTIKMNVVPNSSQTGTSKSGNNASSSSSSSKMLTTTTKKVCLCAPTTHPGSFKCRHHRSLPSSKDGDQLSGRTKQSHNAERKTGLSRFGRPAAATTDEDDENISK